MLVLKTLIYIYYTSKCKSGNLYGTTFYEIQFYQDIYLFITYILGVYWNMFTGNYSGSRMHILYRNLLFILYFSK